MTAPLVILGCGNPSRGDDALGPLLCDRLEDWQPRSAADPDALDLPGQLPTRSAADLPDGRAFEVLQDFQFQVEHALDLEGRDLVLFIDAAVGLSAPFAFTRIGAHADASHTTHALSPQAVLAVYAQLHGRDAPPSYLLRVHGQSFELGAPISGCASAALDAAWPLLKDLLADATEPAWDRRTDASRA